MSGQYVKVLFDFNSCEVGEIPLKEGDIVQVLQKVDDNWLIGQIDHHVGNFPSNFVQAVRLPPAQVGQQVFAATKDFSGEVEGDLTFCRGDVILGVQPVDANWWNGQLGTKSGIFPLTHVRELSVSPAKDTPPRPAPSTLPQSSVPPKQLDTSPTPVFQEKYIALVQASMDLTAQLDDELGFSVGDMIDVVKVTESGFAIGKCNGKQGMFPLSFVKVIEGNLNIPEAKGSKKRTSKFRWWEEESDNSAPVVAPPSGRDTEPAMRSTEPATLKSPTQSSQLKNDRLIVDNAQYSPGTDSSFSHLPISSQTHKRQGSYNQENTNCGDGGITPYGRTLFPFVAENPNEVTFFDSEIVTLIRHIDEQWLEGEVAGKRGIFPTSYVEIIVDCPWADDMQTGAQLTESSGNSSTTVKESSPVDEALDNVEEMYGRVLYDFKAVSDQDLDLREGDTVTVLRQVDEHWFEARHDDDRKGYCPVSYVELISWSQSGDTESTQVNSLKRARSLDTSENTTSIALRNGRLSPADVVSKPAISKPKPKLKPKPQIKPKPTAKSISPSKTQEIESEENETKTDLRTNSYNESSKPSKPVFKQKNISLDSTLDDVISTELKLAVNEVKGGSTVVNVNVPNESTSSTLGRAGDYQGLDQPADGGKSPMGRNWTTFDDDDNFKTVSTTKPEPDHWLAEPRSVPSRPPQPRPDKIKRSNSATEVKLKKKTPPPRPAEPRLTSTPLKPSGPDFGPKPVPHRAAPPRPTAAPMRRAGGKGGVGDLMEFSPERTHVVFECENQENAEVIADLEKRISELEEDLQKCNSCKVELSERLNMADETEKMEIQESLDFYKANIKGLNEESLQLKQNLYELCPERAKAELESKRLAEEQRKLIEEQRRREEEERKHREELRQKHRETREKVIQELMETEASYLESLLNCYDVFLNQVEEDKCPQIDLSTLFYNLDEVIEVSQNLLNSLESGTHGKAFEEQCVGHCFVDMKSEMTRVYAPYCRNHDDASALLEKYKLQPEVMEYFGCMLETLKKQTTVNIFDLGSILIKPVQRILKYPLLLHELIKSTEEDHPDKPQLLAAINAMTDVAAAINEYKRRKDLVRKYKSEADDTLNAKMSRLNVHSAKKKLARLSQKMVGIQTVDEEFTKEEKRFKNLEYSVRNLVRDVTSYMEELKRCLDGQESLANDISDYYDDKSSQDDVKQLGSVHNDLATKLFAVFIGQRSDMENKNQLKEYLCDIEKEKLDMEVVRPLNQLLLMFRVPSKVMKKRHDKLLDYDNLSSRLKNLKDNEQVGSAKEEMQMAKNNYEALNAQLLDELPKLYSLSAAVVKQCTSRLVLAQKSFNSIALKQLCQLLNVSEEERGKRQNVVETFNIEHTTIVDRLSELSFIPRSFNPAVDEIRKSGRGRRSLEPKPALDTELSQQSAGQKLYVRQLYPAEKVFTVDQDCAGALPMDLSLQKGTIVGVIKEGDPMGNKDRWFVDNGAEKGFVHRKLLCPSQEGEAAASSTKTTKKGDLLSFDDPATSNKKRSPEKSSLSDLTTLDPSDFSLSYTSEKEAASQSSSTWYSSSSRDSSSPSHFSVDDTSNGVSYAELQLAQQQYESCECYQAVYSFAARNQLEISLQEGDMVQVLEKHDMDGNTEWWLVKVQGRQGYAPANYLYKLQS